MHDVATDSAVDRVGAWIRRHVDGNPWTSVVGLTRTLLALAMGGTLLATPGAVLFSPGTGEPHGTGCGGMDALTAFCIGGNAHRQIIAWICGGVCILIATGWRPRVTALVQWWIACSFFLTATVADGGDQVMAVLTFFLLPIALTDSRKWHWSKSGRADEPLDWSKLIANWGLVLFKAQVAVIYLDAAISKLGVIQWTNGTAMYYWLHDPMLGVPPALVPFEQRLLGLSGAVVPFTIGVVALEMSLGFAFLYPRRAKKSLFVLAVAFHVGIALVMGLVSFALAMIAGLVIYLLPHDEDPRLVRSVARYVERRSREPDALGPPSGESDVAAPVGSS